MKYNLSTIMRRAWALHREKGYTFRLDNASPLVLAHGIAAAEEPLRLLRSHLP